MNGVMKRILLQLPNRYHCPGDYLPWPSEDKRGEAPCPWPCRSRRVNTSRNYATTTTTLPNFWPVSAYL
jgi:hypothetical protein